MGDQHFDKYLDAQILIPFGEDQHTEKVKRKKLGDNGKIMGQLHSKPIFDTIVYDVEFPDGTEKEFASNIITQNMYSQCEADGNQHLLMDAVNNHMKYHTAI